ncbi:MAG TPA: peptidoglycan DD-metalloendopeptidase family protein [Vicinamibacterales bacterium]|nr:peptidoglycan DD-metalloendopeptidase family protein [Vicinamibacterales bacterium]
MGSERVDDLTATAGSAATQANTPAPTPDRRAQVVQLAQEFEAMLMTQMLRDLRHTMLSDESSGLGNEALSDTTEVELGRALTKAGGLGLSSALLGSLQRQTLGDGTPAPSTTAVPPNAEAPADSATPPTGRVTSPFGWRLDPLTQAPAFHSGVDIAMAYGTPVQAAASGRVVFSGVNGGYGNSVVIEQASGRQVRYAHLASPMVQAGDVVSAGQVIGRSGDTGRATGPHLHYEVLEHGRPVDPSTSD